MKKNSTPYWDSARKAPGVCTSSSATVFQTGLPDDQQGKCSPGDPACWLAVLAGGWQVPTATPGGVAVSQGALLSRLGAQFCCMWRREEGGQGRIRSLALISLTLTAPYRSVLEAGAPQPGEGDATRDTETSGSPGKGPSFPTIHTVISITGPQSLPWLPVPLISTTP